MLSSMTAYGRASFVTPFGRLIVEIQSVNRRYLETSVILPKELSHFEMDVRSWVGEVVGRGQVTLRVEAFFESAAPIKATANLPLARQLGLVWKDIASAVGVEVTGQELLQILAQNEDLIRYQSDVSGDQTYRVPLEDAVKQAIKTFLAMRRQEGAALQADITGRIATIRKAIERIVARSGQATEKYRQRLVAKLQEISPGAIENEERILREVCLYADRVDICEELTRFGSHLQQFEETMQAPKASVGKTLDFILQELNREVNTIGSKAGDYEVAQAVVEVKTELERIREQLQNVE